MTMLFMVLERVFEIMTTAPLSVNHELHEESVPCISWPIAYSRFGGPTHS